uniref:HAT C-terminal dimerisation domain-containing protein n=1 Tax=Latimeria chalumnae TaxID=7897 RepID=H3BEL7_LATCH
AKALNNSVVNIILKDLRPISIVEDKGFREFVELGYQLPSRTFFIEMVEKKYLVTMQNIKVELITPEKIALASDIWTSLATEAYMSVTAHFITKDWQLKSINLATKPLSERHTGENIVTFIEQVFEKFELEPSCICALVCDNGANMVAAAKKLKEKSIRCVGHTIQLVVNSALKVTTIDQTMGAARCLVKHFHRSEAASSALRTKQQQMAVPQHSLKQGWNSTLHMVTCLLEQRWPVTAVLSDSTMTAKRQHYLELQSNQWSLLEEVKQLLEPFEVATTYLSREKYVSLSTVPLHIDALIKEMQPDGNFKTAALEQISNCWKFQNNPSTENAIVIAAALDPRFRKLKFLKPDDVLQLQLGIQKTEVTELVQPTHRNAGQTGQEESPPSIKQTVIDKIFSFEESSSKDSDEEEISCMQKEVMQYFSEKSSSRDTDPLTDQERFPHVSKLARAFLAILATSIPSEWLFSVAGTIASRKRASLTPQHVDMLVFLHSNT